MSYLGGETSGLGPENLKGTVVGVGVTAFPRTGLPGFVPGYRIACIRRTGDLPAVRRTAEVFCLEEAEGRPLPEAADSCALLSRPVTRRYLAQLPQPVYLLLYQPSFEIEELARKNGWRLLANPAALRVRTGDRAFFQRLVASLGLPAVPGGIVSLERFKERSYEAWARDVGPRVVIQLPDMLRGGGRSTFFLDSEGDMRRFKGLISSNEWQGIPLKRVSVRKFVKGEPSSVTGCILGKKAVISPLQRQIIDPSWVEGVPSKGVFGGHSWGGEIWGERVEEEARSQGLAVARVLAAMGYRGVFGLDLLVDRSCGQVVPIELNPRLTGALPVLSQLQAEQGEIPLELLHFLSFLGSLTPFECVIPTKACSGRIQGAHIVLFRGLGSMRKVQPRAGLYAVGESTARVQWIGEAAGPGDIRDKNQVILVDGPPMGRAEGLGKTDPLERIGRLVFSGPVLTPEGRFRPGVLDVVEQMQGLMLER
ncbi:MAG: ATP-grasp domain-containing protein [Desulfatiglandales bacterium]